ncbi:MAG: RluA family pseudouridine synthase [Turicibacter sp.]|nr:RluA family pseudouridine synthase [Turicibacter sp.]
MKVTRKGEHLIFMIEKKQANQTVREFLQQYHLSRKKIHELYMDKSVKLNEEVANFNDVLQIGDQLAIPVFKEESIDFKPQKMKLDIVYEDDHLLIINKPAGLMVHPDQKDGMNTLVNAVAYYYQENQIHHRIRYIHRLDTDTSGGMIFAKHYLAHSLMDYWLSEKKIKRWYLALVSGRLQSKKGKINAPIGKDRHHGARRRVAKNGDEAVTLYQLKQQFKNYALVELELKTGRTHQIRVHMSYLGHPLLGDVLYGGPAKFGPLKRQALHSSRIEMKHPITQEPLKFEISLPSDMKKLI